MTTTMSDDDIMKGRMYLDRSSVLITDEEKAKASITLASVSSNAEEFLGVASMLGLGPDNFEEGLALRFLRSSPESYPHDSMMP